jgi:hypothetical protein
MSVVWMRDDDVYRDNIPPSDKVRFRAKTVALIPCRR